MALAAFYFQLHQPMRLHPDRDKFIWDEMNRDVFTRASNRCYIPAIRMFIDLISEHPTFKITFGISGTFLEQARCDRPEVIRLLQELIDAGAEIPQWNS